MFCKNCGNQLPDGVKFCSVCGAELELSAPTYEEALEKAEEILQQEIPAPDAYDEEVVGQDKKGKDDVRTVLRLHPALAPFKCAILPLSKKDVLTGPAQELYQELSKDFMCDYDETGSIGKRYRREDEIGTPFCITFDFNTVGTEEDPADHCVTVRERDSMQQVRIPVEEVHDYIAARIRL